jgi:hypothetical protein
MEDTRWRVGCISTIQWKQSHTKKLDGEVFIQQCHTHLITVEAVQRGWSHENHAIACDSYATLDEAMLLLSQDFHVQKFAPESSHLDL